MPRPDVTSRIATALWERRHPQWAGGRAGRIDPRLELPARSVPRFALDRLSLRARDRLRGRQPWITTEALDLLDELLQPGDRGLEYGAGGTTAWFAERLEHLVSVEGFDQWHGPLRDELDRRGVRNVDLRLVSAPALGYESSEHRDAYVNVAPELERGSLGLVFVDGEYRDECAMRGLELLAPGGLLVLDNAEAYVPSRSRSPWVLDEPSTPLWAEFCALTADWRRIWTTNGVWDTAIWIKP